LLRSVEGTTNSTLVTLLVFIFRVSYISLKYEKVKHKKFDRWVINKRRLNLIINTRIILWLSEYSRNKISNKGSQFIIDALLEIIEYHYKQRVLIYSISNKIPCLKRSFFLIASISSVYVFNFIRLFFIVLRLRLRCSGIHLENKNEKINIAIGFPTHAFSMFKKNDKDLGKGVEVTVVSSFAEYLTYISSNKNRLISYYEYQRPSKRNECFNNKYEEDELVDSYRRVIVKPESNIAYFFKNMCKLLYGLYVNRFDFRTGFSLFTVIYITKWIYSFSFDMQLNDLGLKYSNVENIYTLPFSNLGLLKYDNEISSKIISFSYSQNTTILPGRQVLNETGFFSEAELVDILADMPLWALSYSGSAVGFTAGYKSVNNIKKMFNEYLGCSFFIKNTSWAKQIPLTLGYENSYDFLPFRKHDKKNILIFDLPPENRNKTLSRALFGDRFAEYDMVEKFISDCVNCSIGSGFRVILKPKYSLSNYEIKYRNLISELKSKYGDDFILLDPYIKLSVVFNVASGCINMPYTSTKLIADSSGVCSIYYLPGEYRDSFLRYEGLSPVIFGKGCMQKFLDRVSV
jgi:hypothetical protein